MSPNIVTILILIDGFLQLMIRKRRFTPQKCHNPYFNRWFSAMLSLKRLLTVDIVTILILIDGFLQYFMELHLKMSDLVTILILIDGFLQ